MPLPTSGGGMPLMERCMTVAASRSSRKASASAGMLRAATWLLHILVAALALGSLLTGLFHVWIDLRWFGAIELLLELLWVATALLLPICVGPYPAGFRSWKQQGYLGAWAAYLLIPTYLLLTILLFNCVKYVFLWREGRADVMLPAPAVAFALLAAWALACREWLRRQEGMPAKAPSPAWKMIGITLVAVALGVLTIAGVALHGYRLPPPAHVDLAVVLGGGVLPDGSASLELINRVRVATSLYKQGRVPHILLSGGIFPPAKPGGPPINELQAMQGVCRDEGIPQDAVTLDPVGINTRATAYNTLDYMQTRHLHSVVICSSDFHLYRTVRSFRERLPSHGDIELYALPGRPADWVCANPWFAARELLAVAVYETNPHYRQPKALIMNLVQPRVIVSKSANRLTLLDGQKLVKTYPCITGGNVGDKEREGDRRTPLGHFKIVFKNPQSKFHLSLGLDYPNAEDAQRGLAAGLITRQQYDQILSALHSDLSLPENQQKLWYTPLGGEIFLHGHAEGRTGTAGCVALSNTDIEELYAILPVGTPVAIEP